MGKIPYYVEEMVDSAVGRLKNLNYATNVSFSFITDTHNCTSYTERALYAIDKISKEVPLSFTCFGGDYLCNNVRTPREEAIRQHKELSELVSKYNSKDIPIMVASGNHDNNPFGPVEHILTQDEVYDIIMSHHEKMFVCDKDSPKSRYGYYDDEKLKLRAIFLDIMDTPLVSGKCLTHDAAFGNRQLNWFADTALKVPSGDWGVVVFAHYAPIPYSYEHNNMIFGGDALWGILCAFKNGTSFSASKKQGDNFYDVSCDYTAQGKGDVIGYIYGHHHADLVWKCDDIPLIGCLAAASDNFTTSECYDGRVHYKTSGSGEESAFSIFNINRDERRIWCIRCGAGPDFSVSY